MIIRLHRKRKKSRSRKTKNIASSSRKRWTTTLGFLDIDHFKEVNDT